MTSRENPERAIFGMGCFWGAERLFREAPGVRATAVGYAGGVGANPAYEEVCSERTGHAEVVAVEFDTAQTSYEEMLRLFWEGHDPTQGMRQGNDVGSQYRSVIFAEDGEQHRKAEASKAAYQATLSAEGYGTITTEVIEGPPVHPFYFAEEYHQRYLEKNVSASVDGGYCGLQPTGIACPVGSNVSRSTADQRSTNSSQ
jgi:peptide-methionine (S)-S-oxide reductase